MTTIPERHLGPQEPIDTIRVCAVCYEPQECERCVRCESCDSTIHVTCGKRVEGWPGLHCPECAEYLREEGEKDNLAGQVQQKEGRAA